MTAACVTQILDHAPSRQPDRRPADLCHPPHDLALVFDHAAPKVRRRGPFRQRRGPDWCSWSDVNLNGAVDLGDLLALEGHWLGRN